MLNANNGRYRVCLRCDGNGCGGLPSVWMTHEELNELVHEIVRNEIQEGGEG